MSAVQRVAARSAIGETVRTGAGHLRAGTSKLWARLRRNPRSSASTGVVAIAALGLLLAMIFADGFRATSYDLKPAGVWVVNTGAHRFGRVNARIREQDGVGDIAVQAAGVLQDGRDVFVQVNEGGLRRVSAATMVADDAVVKLADGASPALGGGRLAVIDAAGVVRMVKAGDASSLSAADEAAGPDGAATAKPKNQQKDPTVVLDEGAGAVMAIGRHGDLVVASPQHHRLSVLRPGVKKPEVVEAKFDGATVDRPIQVSMSGANAVAISGDALVLPDGRRVTIPGGHPKLQLPSDDPDHVLVATDAGILSFRTDGEGAPAVLGEARKTPGAVRPVNIHGCSYAAWAGGQAGVLYVCGSKSRELDFPDGAALTPQSQLAWQVNENYAVLNDLTTGLVLVVSDGKLVKADQWDTTETTGPSDQKSDDRTPDPNFEQAKNTPPEAHDDEFGARPGVPTILPVLDNDKDADGDVLTVRSIKGAPDGTTVQVVRDGTAVQITPAQTLKAGETVSFRYTVSDGWKPNEGPCSKCDATVTVGIADASKDRPPELKKDRPVAHLSVGPKARAEYPVLDDWIDPDGDAVVLSAASVAEAGSAEVSAQTDGLLTYIDRSGVPGERSVTFTVSDVPLTPVASMSSPGTLGVTVEGVNTPPVTRNDYASTAPGLPVVVWPLRNDIDADGDDLNFTLIPAGSVPPEAHQNGDGSVTVTSAVAGSIQFGYQVNDGHNAPVPGRIRVDVLDPSTVPPSAGLDVVVLPAPPASGSPSSRTVDLLTNDVSPSGNVLVVTRVVPHGDPVDGLGYQLLEHRRLLVSYKGRLPQSATLDYTLSDGNTTTTGQVVIVSAESDVNLPPIPVDDDVEVRVGDIVSVPVMSNDIDPEGAELYLRDAKLTRGGGIAFMAGPRVRFLAPKEPGTVTVTYTVGDDPQAGSGNEATGRLTITVRDTASNAAPVPPPVDARVVAGSSVKITVPLAGIDPDGDSVTLLGLGLEGNTPQVPKLGRITATGLDTFTYEAFPGKAGTDVFRYRVVDSGGPTGTPLEAEGVVRVGVAASDGQNGKPTPRADTFTVRPGPARLDVLANDFDPDGDAIFLKTASGPPGLDVKAEDGRVVATFPEVDRPTPFALSYRIEDPSGLPGDADVAVIVDPNAAGAPPVARDDLAQPDPDPKATRVSVHVLENDDDPDGDPAKLTVDVVEGQSVDATVGNDRRLSIAVTARTQLVAYRVTDEQGLTATAIVRVPPAGTTADLPPVLLPNARAVSKGKETGGPVTIKLVDVARDPEGKDLRLDSANFQPVNGKVDPVDGTSFTFTPDPYDPQSGKGTRGVGAASVSFIVSDAPDGQVGQRAVLTLPIDVDLDAPALPAWKSVSPLDISVYHGDKPASIDLRTAVTDDDTDASKLTFDLTPDSPQLKGVKVDIQDGHLLTAVVSDTALAANVDLGTLLVQVTDDTGLHAVDVAHVPVRTIPTDRRPPSLVSFDTEAESGKPTTVDVLQGATSTFDEPIDQAVSLDNSTVRTRSGKGEATVQGTHQITFTPSAGPESVGTATVSFDVVDLVGRRIPGTVSFTVSSVPGAPGAPTVRQLSASSVEVAWAAADKHGKDIQKYTVTDNQQHTKDCTTELFCVIEGLTPGTHYTFTVTATNEHGEGPASEVSPEIRPDECPAAPTNVQLKFDTTANPKTGGQLVASWVKPDNNGTAIEGYDVQVSPASSSPLTELVTGTTVTLSGLTNGAPHKVTVRAKNQCDGGGLGTGAVSNTEIPAGVPDAPTGIKAVDAATPVGGRIDLTWTPPTATGAVSDHGDRVAQYTITAVEGTAGFGNGSPQVIQASSLKANGDGSVTSSLSVDRSGNSYRFTVTATNKAGAGVASAASAAESAHGKPAAPTLVSATFDPEAASSDAQITVNYKETTDAGDDTITYLYKLDSGAWTEVPGGVHTFSGASHSFPLAGLSYGGTTHTVQLKARNDKYETAAATTASSTSTAGGAASAIYGTFDVPSVSCTGSGQSVTCTWTAGTARGNDVTLQLRGSPISEDVKGSGGRTLTVGYGQGGTESVSAADTHGRSKPGNSSSWASAPSPAVSVSIGGTARESDGCVYGDAMAKGDFQGCYYLHINMSNFDGGNHTVSCYMTMAGGGQRPAVYKTINHSGNGSFDDCSFSSAGRWVMVVVDGSIPGGYGGLDMCGFANDNHTGYFSGCTAQWPTN